MFWLGGSQSRPPDMGTEKSAFMSRELRLALLKPQGAFHQNTNPLWRGRFIAWHLRHLFLGECQLGPRYFWSMSGLQHCSQTHLKKGLVPHSSCWWDIWQIYWIRSFAFHLTFIPLGNMWIHLFSLSYGWIVRLTRLLSLGKVTSLGEEKLWIQTSKN